jgi:hypothetical protein
LNRLTSTFDPDFNCDFVSRSRPAPHRSSHRPIRTLRQAIKRRLGEVEMAKAHKLGQFAIEESHQQARDMRAVHN